MILEYLLWLYFITYPLYVYFTHAKERQGVLDDPAKRLTVYITTTIHLWVPTLVLGAVLGITTLQLADIGIRWDWQLSQNIALGLLLLLCGYLLFSLQQVKKTLACPKSLQQLKAQLNHIQWLMPQTLTESRYFIWVLSISAGICEELLFRGYLLHTLENIMPTYAAVLLSSIAFGLGHCYQGTTHILRTTMMGVVLATVYLLSDSILIVIGLHAIIDMYSGALGYRVNLITKTD